MFGREHGEFNRSYDALKGSVSRLVANSDIYDLKAETELMYRAAAKIHKFCDKRAQQNYTRQIHVLKKKLQEAE